MINLYHAKGEKHKKIVQLVHNTEFAQL